jgi:hypothetical protein
MMPNPRVPINVMAYNGKSALPLAEEVPEFCSIEGIYVFLPLILFLFQNLKRSRDAVSF